MVIYYVYKHKGGGMLNSISFKNAGKRRERILSVIESMKVNPGWIKYMRSVLGMTLKDLANLTQLSLPTVAQIEKREAQGKVTLETLAKMAEAMECELVYAFVPKENLTDLIEKKAFEKATESLANADTHMSLEDQKVKGELESRIERVAQKLIEKGKVW